MLSWSPMRFQAREIYWGKDDPEIAGQSTGPLKWTRNGGWMEIRGASKTTPFFSDVFWRAYFIHHDLHGADFWSLPTGQTHELSTRRFFLGGCCRTFQVKFVPPFFLNLFLLEVIKPPCGNFRSTLESLAGNLAVLPGQVHAYADVATDGASKVGKGSDKPWCKSGVIFFFVTSSRDCCHSPCITL